MTMDSQTYTINDLERITSIKAHTIRIWEKRYNLFSPGRTSTNFRRYTDGDLRKLLNIVILLGKGIRISRLAGLSEEELNEQVRTLVAIHDSDSMIESLVIDMIDFDKASFERKLNKLIYSLGFEDALFSVIYPLYSKIGILWQTGVINPAQEHFITNIIRQKFFVAIDALEMVVPGARTFLLFLPENEQHELGLLLYYYLIRKNGHAAIYLGPNVPRTDVIKACNVIRPNYLVTHLTSLIHKEEVVALLKYLASGAEGSRMLVSGPQTTALAGSSVQNVTVLASPEEFKKLLLRRLR
jgi:MerR family transcriptional regulator, light-induced transcriptional regulator